MENKPRKPISTALKHISPPAGYTDPRGHGNHVSSEHKTSQAAVAQ
ncbi:hypothetical protein ACU8KH_00243 [Lachancea thermotolerans]